MLQEPQEVGIIILSVLLDEEMNEWKSDKLTSISNSATRWDLTIIDFWKAHQTFQTH